MAKSLEKNFWVGLRFYAINLFFLFLTYLFSSLFYARIFLRKMLGEKSKRFKILIMANAKIGDMTRISSVFREIKKKYPESYLSVLMLLKVKPIIENNPYIDKIILEDEARFKGFFGAFNLIKEIAAGKYDFSFSLTPTLLNNVAPLWARVPQRATFISKYSPRSTRFSFIFSNRKKEFRRDTPAFRQYLGLLEFLGIYNPDEKIEVFVSDRAKEKATDFLQKNNISENDFLVGISVSSGNPIKDWDLEKFALLSNRLINELKAKIIFVGSNYDKNIIQKTIEMMKCGAINAAGEFALNEVSGLIQKFKMFISVDTGPLYIANALGVPVVDIIGPFNIIEQLDLRDKCEIVSKPLYCFPCVHIIPSVYHCKEGHFRCTRDITVKDVYDAVLRLKNKYFIA